MNHRAKLTLNPRRQPARRAAAPAPSPQQSPAPRIAASHQIQRYV